MTMDQTAAPSFDNASFVERAFGNPAPAPAAPTPAPAPAVAPATQPAAAAPAAAEDTFEQRWEKAYGPKTAELPPDVAKPAVDFIDQAHPDAKAATPIIAELGLGREQATKLHALHQQMTTAAIDRQAATWASEAARLPVADVADAQRAVKQFGTPQLKELLNRTGLGNNPEIIQAFARALRSNPYRGF